MPLAFMSYNFSVKRRNFPILKKCRGMDSFNIISYFSLALNEEFSRHSYLKKCNFYNPDFFSLIHIFCEDMKSIKHL